MYTTCYAKCFMDLKQVASSVFSVQSIGCSVLTLSRDSIEIVALYLHSSIL